MVTPFLIKLLVIDTGALRAILYGSETWGNLKSISRKLIPIELSLLKYALGVKQSTPNDQVYQELSKADIISAVMDGQDKFIKKINSLSGEQAVVKCIWDKSQHLKIAAYYNNLEPNNRSLNRSSRAQQLEHSTRSMDIKYRKLVGLNEYNCL